MVVGASMWLGEEKTGSNFCLEYTALRQWNLDPRQSSLRKHSCI